MQDLTPTVAPLFLHFHSRNNSTTLTSHHTLPSSTQHTMSHYGLKPKKTKTKTKPKTTSTRPPKPLPSPSKINNIIKTTPKKVSVAVPSVQISIEAEFGGINEDSVNSSQLGLRSEIGTPSNPPLHPVAIDAEDFPNSPVAEYISKLEARLEKMEMWQQQNTPEKETSKEQDGDGDEDNQTLNGTATATTPTPNKSSGTPKTSTPSSKKKVKIPKSSTSTSRPNTPTNNNRITSPKISTVDSKGVAHLAWGVLPSKMPDLDSVLNSLPKGSFVVGKVDDPKHRTAAIAKKLYTQLTSLYAHYSAIKVKYDGQQDKIDNAERKTRNANLKTRKAMSRMSGLKGEVEKKQEQLDALQGMVNRLNQKVGKMLL